ncbi:type III pantothenate kinase [Candidatus Sulfidibacterium hydrothermale]|uniref:type III pantothenate kinase n=1 Tax=Candidatus Sulfidibacterium hydrothermale TaxID=2875962 RepID=UPI001F0A69FB|nr:type III pantothenate kinase [Candidatus Sulfidibacterium hydrothermale]UBM62863.1 type III pantothenate kinase [Candidatus Sulfidibacterium hydrothermale]
MKLIIDIGNTRSKIAVFSEKQMESVWVYTSLSTDILKDIVKDYPDIHAAILSSVTTYPKEIDTFLSQRFYYLKLDSQTPLPVKLLYKTPQTLGKDRMAIAAAAQAFAPGENVLVIDAGTTITYDIVNHKGEYLGGAISPGLQMRLKALHTFTGKLPLIKQLVATPPLVGNDTNTSIASGVLNGITAEMEGMIRAYAKRFPGLKIVLSGGDEKYFDKRLKNNIFALPNFVLQGLKEILDFNEKKSEDKV